MATLKPPILRFREKNPNLFQLQLMRDDQAIVPSDNLVIKIELRADPAGRILNILTLEQTDSESPVLSCSLPALVAGLYYVDLRLEPTALPTAWSGLCLLSILPIGSLETISDVLGLTATLDERNLILQADLDSMAGSTLAAVAAELSNQQAQAARDESVTAKDISIEQAGIATDQASIATDAAQYLQDQKANMLVYAGTDDYGIFTLVAGDNITVTTDNTGSYPEFVLTIPD